MQFLQLQRRLKRRVLDDAAAILVLKITKTRNFRGVVIYRTANVFARSEGAHADVGHHMLSSGDPHVRHRRRDR